METYEIIQACEGVRVIREKDMVNAFLLEGEKQALLVDSGFGGGDIAALVRSLTDKPVMLANTHADPDHTGGNRQFDAVFLHPSEYTHYRSRPEQREDRLLSLREGDRLDLGGLTAEVILTPGHTPGSIAFLLKERRLLLSGDSVAERPIFMFGERRSIEAYIDSMERLRQRAGEFDTIWPSHGGEPLKPEILDRLIVAAQLLQGGQLEPIDPPMEIPAKLYTHNGVSFFYE